MLGGPKNYAYITAAGKAMSKVKGLTLNCQPSNLVFPDTLEKMLKKDVESVDVVYPYFIQRTRKHKV